jgi:hypothetical protein
MRSGAWLLFVLTIFRPVLPFAFEFEGFDWGSLEPTIGFEPMTC